jgi:hypothetical protein
MPTRRKASRYAEWLLIFLYGGLTHPDAVYNPAAFIAFLCFSTKRAMKMGPMTEPNTPPPADSPKLLDQVRARIRAKHYSIRTETQYVGAAERPKWRLS